MLKRIFPFVVALAVVLSSVLMPFTVSAASVYDGDSFHPLISFDSIYGGAGYSLVEWPFVSVRLGSTSSDSQFSLANGMLTGAMTVTATDIARLNGWFYYPPVAGSLGKETTITLKSDSSFVVYREGLRPEGAFDISTDGEDLEIVRVRLSGSFAYMTKTLDSTSGKELYVKRTESFNMSFGAKNGIAPIGDYLYQAIMGCELIEDIFYPMVEGLTVELDVVRRDVDTPKFYVSAILTSDTYSVSDWLGCYLMADGTNQPTDPPLDPSFNWLATVVNGFLKTEFLPGFSFDTLIHSVIVIGFLLWFIKIIS